MDWNEVVEKIPYTIPWWQNLSRAALHAPERYYRRLNGIVDFFEFSCNGNLIMYVQTLFPALGEFVLGLLAFDIDDVARGFLRPYGPSGRKSLVFDPLKRKWEWEIPELGEEIGKRIPGAKFFKASKWWGKTRVLWVIDGVIQRVLYVWLIIDLVSQFLYNWSSGILKHPACVGEGWVCRYGVYGESGNDGEKGLVLCGINSEQYGKLPEGVHVSGNLIVTERPVAVLLAYTFLPVFPLACNFRYRLAVRKRGGGGIVDVSPSEDTWSREYRSAMMVARLYHPGEYECIGIVDGSNCYTIFQGLDLVAIKSI